MSNQELLGLTVTVKRATWRPNRQFFGIIIILGLGGLLESYYASRNIFTGFSLRDFLILVPWGVSIGLLTGLVIALVLRVHSPFPRALVGTVFLDKVDDGQLWFHRENGSPHHMTLKKIAVNAYGEKTIHLVLIPRTLVVEMRDRKAMEDLCTALRPEVRILRFYEDVPSEQELGERS